LALEADVVSADSQVGEGTAISSVSRVVGDKAVSSSLGEGNDEITSFVSWETLVSPQAIVKNNMIITIIHIHWIQGLSLCSPNSVVMMLL
jgi:hypothetical protein